MSDKYTVEQARVALDSLDDYARMSFGVDAIGPRKVLESFIEQAAQMMRERDVGGVVTDEEVKDALNACRDNIQKQGYSRPASGPDGDIVYQKAMRAALESFAARRAPVPDVIRVMEQLPDNRAATRHELIRAMTLAAAPEVTNVSPE